ncbi:unnamed protein product [Nippostrongylus brasiliensis]|uniref:BAR domain-containing protein n=1 Tax=Nippostrongylus brasiliensis TaxID=27835 RepID=A0A0N4YAA5_NIPBR|nr:unnamed protein product [Nippostrongylus brasiliensis]
MGKKSELFKNLQEPMRQEVGALSKLMASCIDETGQEVPECGDALVEVSQATYALAKAIVEVADGSEKDTIKSACDKFIKDLYTEDLNKSLFELTQELGTAVVKAF